MNKAFKVLFITIIAIAIIGFLGMLIMDVSPVGIGMHDEIFQTDGIALGGYDPVAYLNPGEPLKGSPEFSATHNGATWYFISDKHLKKFAQRPEFYMPKYGGHCAYAASKGFAAPGNGEFWLRKDNELYFFSNEEVMVEFEKDAASMVQAADNNWK